MNSEFTWLHIEYYENPTIWTVVTDCGKGDMDNRESDMNHNVTVNHR